MDQRAPQEYVLEIFADQTFVKDIVKGLYGRTDHTAELT